MTLFVCLLQQEAEGEHQRPDEDGAETGAGDDSQEHRGGSKAPHSGVNFSQIDFHITFNKTACISLLCVCVCLCVGCHSEDHEDEEGPEAPAASGRSPEPAVVPIQTQSPCHQGNAHTHTHYNTHI